VPICLVFSDLVTYIQYNVMKPVSTLTITLTFQSLHSSAFLQCKPCRQLHFVLFCKKAIFGTTMVSVNSLWWLLVTLIVGVNSHCVSVITTYIICTYILLCLHTDILTNIILPIPSINFPNLYNIRFHMYVYTLFLAKASVHLPELCFGYPTIGL